MSKVTVRQNQSWLDIVIQETGSAEALRQFCKDNDLSASQIPVVGDEYEVSDAAKALGNKAVLKYLAENNIILGTENTPPPPIPPPPPPPLSLRTILYPKMKVMPTTGLSPEDNGSYNYDFLADTGFINLYDLQLAWPNKKIYFETQAQWLSGVARSEFTGVEYPGGQTAKRLNFDLAWPGVLGSMMHFGADTDHKINFEDINGNIATFMPLVVFDTVTQNVREFLIANLLIELVSSDGVTASLRLTRSHAPSVGLMTHTPYGHLTMFWGDDALVGSPDPADPTNANKTIITVGTGIYRFSVKTKYENDVLHQDYPSSYVTVVAEVY